ncbi:rod shape-determining protein MreD [Lutibacter sp. TH_r2]|uniref:rod shape-determining protein MreD n=1 Tax=Lutibacter sp. TH_r2 TaxID=3082083 RepID=UPI0029546CCD|nr:rod shape-determining protein MreD [Lutibacter sp. TH_r2]MDV7187054.1 rod shape-determining protein MreD [Lutibacter sp. TH_r2]
MNNVYFLNSIRFIGLLLLQVLVLNKLNLFGTINPMVYIVWVFLFPYKKNLNSILLLSFLLGLAVDFFSDSGGINASATLFIAFIRLPILKLVLGKSDFDYPLFNLRNISFGKSLLFLSTLTIIHHFIVFMLAYFSFSAIYLIITSTIFTSIATIILSVLGIIIFTNKK